MPFKGFKIPEKPFMMQRPMVRVVYALSPLVLASVYLFGLRSLALLAMILILGVITEGFFTYRQGKPVTSAVFVTCLIYHLSLPPTIPFVMAAMGIIFGVVFGKMVFGGFGQNVFNPAMVGRCFVYITFPVQMTNAWVSPVGGWAGGLMHWSPGMDAVSTATPLALIKGGESVPWQNLFLGNVAGSLGETSALLIIICGCFLIYKKAAPWRLAVSCLIGGIGFSGLFSLLGFSQIANPLYTILSGAFLFGTFFIVTEPISGSKTKPGQWIYGFFIGSLVVVFRGWANFPEGLMFAVLIMNAFVPLMDQTIQQIQQARKAAKAEGK